MRSLTFAVASPLLLAACQRGNPTPAPASDAGQSGFVATLGADTVQLEAYRVFGDRIEGTVVTRTPVLRVARWTMSLAADGRPAKYTIETRDAAGARVAASGSMTYAGDTILRETLRNGQMETQRVSSQIAALPSPSLPYVGVSYVMYELALNDARRRRDTAVTQLGMIAQQGAPQRTRAWFPSPDSAEISYFGVAKSGYKFDADGRLLRADWRGTTYGYEIKRVANVDIEAAVRAWTGAVFGALSPRDTARGEIGPAQIVIDYSRPSRRGRVIWGTVVPWDKVWRLGADVATHMTTSADLVIGGTTVPAGRYTLWMLPSQGQSLLVVSTAVNVFGTNYNPARDFARIPLARYDATTPEQLTLRIGAGVLAIQWGDVTWSVPVSAK